MCAASPQCQWAITLVEPLLATDITATSCAVLLPLLTVLKSLANLDNSTNCRRLVSVDLYQSGLLCTGPSRNGACQTQRMHHAHRENTAA